MFKLSILLFSFFITTSLISHNLLAINSNLVIPEQEPTITINENNTLYNHDISTDYTTYFSIINPTDTSASVYPNISKPGKNIDIYIPNSSLINLDLTNATFYYQKDSDIIPITFDNNITAYNGVYANASIPSDVAIGCYNLMVSSPSGISAIICAIELVASNQASIDSAVVDIYDVGVLNIYGDNTHFTSNSLVVSYASPMLSNSIDSVVVINDQHIKAYGTFALYAIKTVSLFEAWVKVYNNIDDTLTYPFKALFFSSIGELNSFNNIRYFPNPTKDIVRIQSDEFTGNSILAEVYSPNGKLILSHKFTKDEPVVIDLKSYASGLYNIRVSTNNKTKTLNVIRR